jgi:pantoate--beta-alanine ligase
MKVVSTIKELEKQTRKINPSVIGFVPTMGALHLGHLALVKRAVEESNLTIVSIYVNPTQFNDKDDLRNYPRTLDEDIKMLGTELRADDMVFTPDDSEIYPVEDKRVFHFGNLENVMEALHRPGHFNGVAQVVSRLFEIVKPDFAVFGLKDFQQVAVIKDLIRQQQYKIKIVENPIIREPDGLAMSSRNRLLTPDFRKRAPMIYSSIKKVAEIISHSDIESAKEYVRISLSENGLQTEYFEIVDNKELVPINLKAEMKKGKRYFGCIAVKAGKIRLIDNIEIKVE